MKIARGGMKCLIQYTGIQMVDAEITTKLTNQVTSTMIIDKFLLHLVLAYLNIPIHHHSGSISARIAASSASDGSLFSMVLSVAMAVAS